MQKGFRNLRKSFLHFNHPKGIPQLARRANITLCKQYITFPPGNISLSRQGKYHWEMRKSLFRISLCPVSFCRLRTIGSLDFAGCWGSPLPGAFLSCFGKKGSKEADLGEALHKIFRYQSVILTLFARFYSRPPPRPSPGRCATVEGANIDFCWCAKQSTL